MAPGAPTSGAPGHIILCDVAVLERFGRREHPFRTLGRFGRLPAHDLVPDPRHEAGHRSARHGTGQVRHQRRLLPALSFGPSPEPIPEALAPLGPPLPQLLALLLIEDPPLPLLLFLLFTASQEAEDQPRAQGDAHRRQRIVTNPAAHRTKHVGLVTDLL